MKKKLLVGLALVLVFILLMPSLALAAQPIPFNASGIVTSITPGTVALAGESGRYRIIERELYGVVSGDINGEFVLSYKGNVELETQAGNIHGTITAGALILEMNGKVLPLEMVPVGPGVYLPKLTLLGHFTMLKGGKGQGELEAWAIFIPTPEGHVGTILASSFTLTGKWQP